MSPESRICPILRKAGSLEEAAARAQLRVREAMRKAILAEVGQAVGFKHWSLSQLLAAIDREIATGSGQAVAEAIRDISTAYGLGDDLVGALTPGSLVGTGRTLVQAAIEVTTEQTRAVWAELGARLRSAIRRVTLGVTDPYQGIVAVAKLIRDPKTFAGAFARAEAIVRTETNRTFSLATWKRMQEAAALARGYSVGKYWLTAEDNRVRDDHVQAGETYSKDNPIPWDEDFIVGGEAMRFPLDPRASAAQTINCRCVSVPVVTLDQAEAA